jgi:hypothetical protein
MVKGGAPAIEVGRLPPQSCPRRSAGATYGKVEKTQQAKKPVRRGHVCVVPLRALRWRRHLETEKGTEFMGLRVRRETMKLMS